MIGDHFAADLPTFDAPQFFVSRDMRGKHGLYSSYTQGCATWRDFPGINGVGLIAEWAKYL
jgi:hypothetical protein